jgi:hypothetical protein
VCSNLKKNDKVITIKVVGMLISVEIENFNDIPEFYKDMINCWVEFGGGQTKTPLKEIFLINLVS